MRDNRSRHLVRQPAKGRDYWYHAPPGGKRTRIKAEHGTPAFWAELAAAQAAHSAAKAPAADPAPAKEAAAPPAGKYDAVTLDPATTTVNRLIDLWLDSAKFAALKPSSRESYGFKIAFIRDEIGAMPVAALTNPVVHKLREEAVKKRGRDTRATTKGTAYRTADYVVQTLSSSIKWSRLAHGLFTDRPNPCLGMGKVARPAAAAPVPVVNRRWTDEEFSNFILHSPFHIALAAALGRYAGLPKGDVIRWEWSRVLGGSIVSDLTPVPAEGDDPATYRRVSGVTAKRQVQVSIPLVPELRDLLARAPRLGPRIVASKRAPGGFSYDGLNTIWQRNMRRLVEAGLVGPGLTCHGLRHTLICELAEAGCTVQAIIAVSGHRNPNSVLPYVQQIQNAGLADDAMARWQAARAARAGRSRGPVLEHEPPAPPLAIAAE